MAADRRPLGRMASRESWHSPGSLVGRDNDGGDGPERADYSYCRARRVTLCYQTGQDHRRSLAETHPRLGQAEDLAALPLGCGAQECRACRDLEAVEHPG